MEETPIKSAERQASLEYLRPGKQTEITEQIERLASAIEGSFEDKVNQIFDIVKRCPYKIENKNHVFRKRTADQIITDNYMTGCVDKAVVFVALARAVRIPAKYIETLDNEWLKSADTHHISGHAYAEIFDDEKWRVVDPSRGKIDADISTDGRSVFGAGFDSWDLGLTDWDSMRAEFTKFVGREEFPKVEDMITPEQKLASEIRSRFKFQERPQFLDESVVDKENVEARRLPKPEESDSMDNNVRGLGKIFKGSDIRWQLDGALNISLMKGEYIGVHKDVDLSIESVDLEKLDAQLIRNGYGLFLSTENPNDKTRRRMERVGAQQFRKAPKAHLMIAAIDEQGKIKETETLNYMDVHLIKRDKDGNPLGYNDIKLPKKWYEPESKIYKEAEINLSHPAKVAYFKIHDTRSFDETDLHRLAEIGSLTIEDVDEIERVCEQEFSFRLHEAEVLVNKIAGNITPGMSSSDIYKAFANEPVIADGLEQNEFIREKLKKLAGQISETDRSLEKIKQLSFNIFNIEKTIEDQRSKVNSLRGWVTDSIRLKELRSNLS